MVDRRQGISVVSLGFVVLAVPLARGAEDKAPVKPSTARTLRLPDKPYH